MVVKPACSIGVLLEELEEVKRCFEAKLEGAIGTVIWGFVAGLLELGRQGEDTLTGPRSTVLRV